MWCIVLQPKGNSRNAVIPADRCEESPGVDLASAILRRATKPVFIGTWKWNGQVLHLFGYKTGKSGTENKHELPPPHDNVTLYGEAVIIATKPDNKPLNFGTAEYTKFYKEAHEGLEDLGEANSTDDDDDSEESEEEPEEDAESLPSEDSAESEEIVEDDDEESVAPAPVAKLVKTKRPNKKMPTWYTIPQLTPEPYTLVGKAGAVTTV